MAGVFLAGGVVGVFVTVTVFCDLTGGAALTEVAAFLPSCAAVAAFGVFTASAVFCDLTDGAGVAFFGAVCPVGFAVGGAGRSAAPAIFAFSPDAAGESLLRTFGDVFAVVRAIAGMGLTE